MNQIEDLICVHPFFAGLGQEFCLFVARCGINQHYAGGQYLAHEGESAEALFLIRKGNIAVETKVPERGAVIIETLNDGDIAGWSWFFPPYLWSFDLHALTNVSVIALNARCLRDKCEDDPRLGYEIAKRLARMMTERLKNTRLRLLDLYKAPPDLPHRGP
jgi:CRP-like cAMP-binding protein